MWRPRAKRDRTWQCSASGLILGDCTERHLEGSAYCYYHTKVQQELVTYFEANMSRGLTQVAGSHYYLVWPLPKNGYVLLYQEEVS